MEEWNHRLTNPELRCKNKCGFYGNPIYQGYCSKCYKEVMRDADSHRMIEPPIDQEEGGWNSGLGFSKFAMKKSIFSTAKGHNKLFKTPIKRTVGSVPSGSGNNVTGAGPTASIPTQPNNVSHEPKKKSNSFSRNSDPFNEFMKTLKKPAAQDIVQHLKVFKKQVMDKSLVTVADQSEMVQNFYETTTERLKSHPLFDQMSDEEQNEMMDGIEKHLMTSIYNRVFSPASCEDEVKDILLLRRINMLHWLKASHLDAPLDMSNYDIQQVFEQAREELWNMETKKAPQDKLSCICRSCNKLLEALRLSQGAPASADEFLPALIFLIIHTSCQHMYSNINYIERFSQPVRLMSGETGYYFTNLCGAVLFIENVSAEHLKLSQEEFNSKMGYVDGKSDADLLIEEIDVDEDYERIVVLQSCSDAMKELSDHVCDMSEEIDLLKEQMIEFHTGVKQQVESILRHPPPRSLYKKNTSPIGSSRSPKHTRDVPPPRTSYVTDTVPPLPPGTSHVTNIPPTIPPYTTMLNIDTQNIDMSSFDHSNEMDPFDVTPPPLDTQNIDMSSFDHSNEMDPFDVTPPPLPARNNPKTPPTNRELPLPPLIKFD